MSSPRRVQIIRFSYAGWLLAALFSLPCLLASPLLVARTAEGIVAFGAEDYEHAYEELHPEAEDGDTEALYYLARLYDHGNGVERDSDRVFEFSDESIDSGTRIGSQRERGEPLAGGYGDGLLAVASDLIVPVSRRSVR